jgi:hypothetical protein
LQIIFSGISIGVTGYSLSSIPWFVYFVAFSWPLFLLPLQEVVKRYDKKEYLRFQKRSRLEFSTKLGEAKETAMIFLRYSFVFIFQECILRCKLERVVYL